MTESVITELDDGVLTVTLNEPETMNSLTSGIMEGLAAAVQRASDDEAVRVMLLTGSGRAFCAGAAVGSLAGGNARDARSSRKQQLDNH